MAHDLKVIVALHLEQKQAFQAYYHACASFGVDSVEAEELRVVWRAAWTRYIVELRKADSQRRIRIARVLA